MSYVITNFILFYMHWILQYLWYLLLDLFNLDYRNIKQIKNIAAAIVTI